MTRTFRTAAVWLCVAVAIVTAWSLAQAEERVALPPGSSIRGLVFEKDQVPAELAAALERIDKLEARVATLEADLALARRVPIVKYDVSEQTSLGDLMDQMKERSR